MTNVSASPAQRPFPPRRPGIDVSAVVVNYNGRALLRDCLLSLRSALAATDATGEIVVIENASTDGSREMLAQDFPDVRVVASDTNLGFAGASQLSIATADGEWLFFVNNDATVEREAISKLLAQGRRHADVGAVAAQMRFADRPLIVNSAGLAIDRLGIAFDLAIGEPVDEQPAGVREVFGACGGAVLYRRAMLEQIGGFDASFFMYLEDVDVAWRARSHGWRTLLVPQAIVMHHHSRSAGHRSDFKYFHVGRNRVRLLAKNATTAHLLRWWPLIVGYDLAYVAYAFAVDRTTAPLKGRVKGLREWRSYRSRHRPQRHVVLAPPRGMRRALARNAAAGPGAGV